MKPPPKLPKRVWIYHEHGATLYIQANLPHCLDTLPKLLTIEGQGSGRQDPPPLAPPEEPAND